MPELNSQFVSRPRAVPIVRPQRTFPCWFMACLGSLTVGIFAPVFLACLYSQGQPEEMGDHFNHPSFESRVEDSPPFQKVLREFMQLQFGATLFCGPGAFILTLILYSILKGTSQSCLAAGELIQRGVFWGIVLAFANIPGYLCGFVIGWQQPLAELRIGLLFASAGAVSGAWIGWQAWRALHPEAGFFPQFSLKTLLTVTLCLGALLAIFAPAR